MINYLLLRQMLDVILVHSNSERCEISNFLGRREDCVKRLREEEILETVEEVEIVHSPIVPQLNHSYDLLSKALRFCLRLLAFLR